MVCATSKASDQPAHARSLIRDFACRLSILVLLSYWLNMLWGFLSLKGGCRCSSESTHVKMPRCWKSHALAQLINEALQKSMSPVRGYGRHSPKQVMIKRKWAVTWDFQQCGILTCVDSNEPVQPPFKLRTSKGCSVNSLTIIEYSSD